MPVPVPVPVPVHVLSSMQQRLFRFAPRVSRAFYCHAAVTRHRGTPSARAVSHAHHRLAVAPPRHGRAVMATAPHADEAKADAPVVSKRSAATGTGTSESEPTDAGAAGARTFAPSEYTRKVYTLLFCLRPSPADGSTQQVLLGMKKRGFGEGVCWCWTAVLGATTLTCGAGKSARAHGARAVAVSRQTERVWRQGGAR